MRYIDLHTHSCFSDGSSTPEELLALAAEADLAAVALTDHDTVKGLPRFFAAARQYPEIEAIGGVEISTLYGARELHFVGLGVDPEHPGLLAFLELMRQRRLDRNSTLARKLKSLGYEVDFAELGGEDNDSLGRPHFARFLVERYQFKSLQEVFDKLLKRGAPAYTPRELPAPYAAIDIINQAGGLAVWAHPVYRGRNESSFVRRMLKKFVPAGLSAIECYYSLFSPTETQMLTEMADNFGIGRSGGSDFHGLNTPDIQLGSGAGGLRVPEELLRELKSRLKALPDG